MPDLSFRVGDVRAMRYAAVPTVAATLHLANRPLDEEIQSVSLNCQIQILPLGRSYTQEEVDRLLDLFGEREQWGRTMKPLHWLNVPVKVPPFRGETAVELSLPCSLDFEVAANKYFYGLNAGSVAINAMLSGTVFFLGDGGRVQIAQIPWDREARFQLPIDIWKAAVDAHYPETAWLRLPRDVFDRLYRYKVAHRIPFWARLIEQLLDQAEETEAPAPTIHGAER